MILRLSDEQIALGAESLSNNRLTASQVEDLVAIFRNYLSDLAGNYSLESTLTALEDTPAKRTCAKLATCLMLWQENEFDNGGFEATLANKTGFNFSLDIQNYHIFRYAFGLLWNLPPELENRYLGTGRIRVSQQGKFINTL